jgi:hypothetical protein
MWYRVALTKVHDGIILWKDAGRLGELRDGAISIREEEMCICTLEQTSNEPNMRTTFLPFLSHPATANASTVTSPDPASLFTIPTIRRLLQQRVVRSHLDQDRDRSQSMSMSLSFVPERERRPLAHQMVNGDVKVQLVVVIV